MTLRQGKPWSQSGREAEAQRRPGGLGRRRGPRPMRRGRCPRPDHCGGVPASGGGCGPCLSQAGDADGEAEGPWGCSCDLEASCCYWPPSPVVAPYTSEKALLVETLPGCATSSISTGALTVLSLNTPVRRLQSPSHRGPGCSGLKGWSSESMTKDYLRQGLPLPPTRRQCPTSLTLFFTSNIWLSGWLFWPPPECHHHHLRPGRHPLGTCPVPGTALACAGPHCPGCPPWPTGPARFYGRVN